MNIINITGSLKSKDSGLSPEPNFEKYHEDERFRGSDFLVS